MEPTIIEILFPKGVRSGAFASALAAGGACFIFHSCGESFNTFEVINHENERSYFETIKGHANSLGAARVREKKVEVDHEG